MKKTLVLAALLTIAAVQAIAQDKGTYYSVLEVTPTDDAWVAAYLPVADRLVAAHGGTYLARTPTHERLEGKGEDAALRIIIEWPSKDAALAFANDPEYAPHLKARTEGSTSHHYLIEGKDALAQPSGQ
ncbi:DUF1330 domain-containing protein [Microbulbifer sp. S227A]|uniref:DUF1330 domain-containing protein n=1 Tax=Microbulbifer sp. S227A TaxID=3415131 RepID=UPI003C79BA3A